MTEYGTIKIPRGEYDRHNERRQEMKLSWADYIDGQAPEREGVDYAEIETRVERAIKDAMEGRR